MHVLVPMRLLWSTVSVSLQLHCTFMCSVLCMHVCTAALAVNTKWFIVAGLAILVPFALRLDSAGAVGCELFLVLLQSVVDGSRPHAELSV